jgi:hypothetical protein
MRELTIQTIFESLSRAQWEVASRTYGNSHSTLIGLLVDWWIRLSPDSHTVLDGPPSHGRRNAGQADAVLCCHEKPMGVLEVEGTDWLRKVKSIVNYSETERPDLKSIRFGVLLLYRTMAKGRGKKRQYHRIEKPIFNSIERATREHPGRAIIAIELHKGFRRFPSGVRSISPYYFGTMDEVTGVLFTQGKEGGRVVLFDSREARVEVARVTDY